MTICARVVPISVAHKSLLRLNLWLRGQVGVARARILLLTMAKCCSCAGKRYKKTMRGKKGKSKVWKKVSAEESRLMKMWYKEDGKAPAEIARLLHRDKGTISRRLHNEGPPQKQGAKCILTPAQVDRLIAKTKAYIKQAKGRYRITYQIIKNRTRCKASVKTIMREFHKRGTTFRKMREKPLLTDEDIADRFSFGRKYKGKPPGWWLKKIDAHWDGKWFKVFLNGKARKHAATQKVFGAFRGCGDGDGLKAPYVRSRKDLKYNTGARGVMVLAAVGKGKVLLWEYLHKKRWSAKTAADMHSGPLAKALRKAYPCRRKFTVLEDNDPSGFKTQAAEKAKKAAGIKPFVIPKRSPQLNVMDFAIWAKVNTNMRAQERRWAANRKETRDQYLLRLWRTAMRLSPKVINKSIMNMKVRCQRLYDAKGGHIEEGGQKRCKKAQ